MKGLTMYNESFKQIYEQHSDQIAAAKTEQDYENVCKSIATEFVKEHNDVFCEFILKNGTLEIGIIIANEDGTIAHRGTCIFGIEYPTGSEN